MAWRNERGERRGGVRKENEIEVESKSINDNLKNTRPSSILNLRCFLWEERKGNKKKVGKIHCLVWNILLRRKEITFLFG